MWFIVFLAFFVGIGLIHSEYALSQQQEIKPVKVVRRRAIRKVARRHLWFRAESDKEFSDKMTEVLSTIELAARTRHGHVDEDDLEEALRTFRYAINAVPQRVATQSRQIISTLETAIRFGDDEIWNSLCKSIGEFPHQYGSAYLRTLALGFHDPKMIINATTVLALFQDPETLVGVSLILSDPRIRKIRDKYELFSNLEVFPPHSGTATELILFVQTYPNAPESPGIVRVLSKWVKEVDIPNPTRKQIVLKDILVSGLRDILELPGDNPSSGWAYIALMDLARTKDETIYAWIDRGIALIDAKYPKRSKEIIGTLVNEYELIKQDEKKSKALATKLSNLVFGKEQEESNEYYEALVALASLGKYASQWRLKMRGVQIGDEYEEYAYELEDALNEMEKELNVPDPSGKPRKKKVKKASKKMARKKKAL